MIYVTLICDILHYLENFLMAILCMLIYAYPHIMKRVAMLSKNLTQEISQLEANFCAALSDPTRLLILYALNEKPLNVTEIQNEIGASQPATSRHLKTLRERGLVEASRQGTVITYSLADKRLIQALDMLRAVMRDRLVQKANLMVEP